MGKREKAIAATTFVIVALMALSPSTHSARRMRTISDTLSPNWGIIFNPDGTLRDDGDGSGTLRPNGIPDAFDFGAKGAVFIRDEISAGAAIDHTILAGSESTWTSGTVPPDQDLGNAYLYEAPDTDGRTVLFFGIERLTAAPETAVELELNQSPFRLEESRNGEPGRIAGTRSIDDLMVRLQYGGNGALDAVDIFKWSVDGNSEQADVGFGWTHVANLSGEGCNETATVCAIGNSDPIPAGIWKSYGAAGQFTGTLAPNTVSVLSISINDLAGRDPSFIGVQVRTARDFALAHILGNIGDGWAAANDEIVSQDEMDASRTQDLQSSAEAPSAFIAPKNVQFALLACRNDGSLRLPNEQGRFVCPDNTYTAGNLGKGWNELDLVPHRLTTQLGKQGDAPTAYNIIVAADNQDQGKTGYDVLLAPVVNRAGSDASCTIAGGTQSFQSGVTGGTGTVVYSEFTISQDKGTTCVFDYAQRLALGAHLFPGSSLQSYMFENQDFKTGKKTLSIPVNAILGQGLRKDMAAVQDTDHTWEITKSPAQATVMFPNTCETSSQGVQMTVSWKRLPAAATGEVTVVTHVYAANPASRTITAQLRDVVYSGVRPLEQSPPVTVDIPPNTTDFLALTHTISVPNGTTNLNDVATAGYTDKATGVAVPGQTTATASAIAQLSGRELDKTAIVKDVERISGTSLRHSADAFTGAGGAWDNYAPGTPTVDQVSWTSSSQNDGGSVTFNRTVYVDKGTVTTGQLKHQATLSGSDRFTTQTPATDFSIIAQAKANLIISASLDAAAQAAATLDFEVRSLSGGGVVTPAPRITIDPGQTSGSVTVPALDQGRYQVTIVNSANLTGAAGQTQVVDITSPKCSGTASFNAEGGGVLQVSKTVDWNGTASGDQTFEICIQGPSYAAPDCKLTKGGTLIWNHLIPGQYTVTEKDPGNSWISIVSGSPATVPASGGHGSAAVSNTRKLNSSLVVTKTVNWNGATPDNQSFGICIQGPSYSAPDCKSTGGGPLVWSNLIPGEYTVTEKDPGSAWVSSVAPSKVTVPGDGGTGTAAVTNNRKLGSLQITKTVDWNGIAPDGQSFQICIQGPSFPDAPNCKSTSGGVLTWSNLIQGQYTVTETDPGTAWTSTISGSPATVTAEGGRITVANTRNGITPQPGGSAHSIGYWKNWASAAKSHGNQKHVLDQTLALAEPAGITIGILALHGDVHNRDAAPDALKAVRLLNKSRIDTGGKMASDPAFNLAAQLLAADLNVITGAPACSDAMSAINAAHSLLASINFDGIRHGVIPSTLAAEANHLAEVLDQYNNNLLCR